MLAASHLLALAVEAGLLWAVARLGLGLASGPAGWALALLFAAIVVAVWARWAAPRAARRLHGAVLLGLKAGLFALGTAAFAITSAPAVAISFAVVAAVHLGLASRLGAL